MITMPVKQKNHNFIDTVVMQWLDLHYPSDSSFDGRVFIGYRPENASGIYNLTRRNIDELAEFMREMHISKSCDYYITANSVSGIRRVTDDVFGLHNIVIDIDCHGKDVAGNPNMLAQSLVWLCSQDLWRYGDYPQPNSVVYTGRGVQLWWAIDAISVKLDWMYQKILVWLMDGIQRIINDNKATLKGISIDRAAGKRIAGWFRLPCTYNTNAGVWGTLQILSSERYSHQDLFDYIPKKYKSPYEKPDIKKSIDYRTNPDYVPLAADDTSVIKGGTTNMALRVYQLVQLRAIRNAAIGEEMRDRFCFAVYCLLLADYSKFEAWQRLLHFNNGFKEPLNERKLAQMMSSATKKEYKISNKKLIEMLEITEEEQRRVKLYAVEGLRVVGRGSNFTRDLIRDTNKTERNRKIIELHEEGTPKAEISRILGVSRNTVKSVLKEYEDLLQSEIDATNENIENENPSEIEFSAGAIRVVKNGAYIFVSYGGDSPKEQTVTEGLSPLVQYSADITDDSPPRTRSV